MTTPGAPERLRVCFVCSGNICRSPMAEAVLRDLLERRGYGDRVDVCSAATGTWHLGQPADPRAEAALERHGLDIAGHAARQFQRDWFDRLDLVVALDRGHERALRALADADDARAKIRLLRDFDASATDPDVADPYYSDDETFARVLGDIRAAVDGLADELVAALPSASGGRSTA